MKYKRIKLLGVMLTLALVIGLLPVMSFTVFAAELSENFPETNNKEKTEYTGDHFKITVNDAGDGDGFYLDSRTGRDCTMNCVKGKSTGG